MLTTFIRKVYEEIPEQDTIKPEDNRLVDSLVWAAHDRLTPSIKGSIEDHRDACHLMKALDQPPPGCVRVCANGLRTRGSVAVDNSSYLLSLFWSYGRRKRHEGTEASVFEVIQRVLR